MFRRFTGFRISGVVACALLSLPVAAATQSMETGAIAVMPFGASVWDVHSRNSASIISAVVQEELARSGRFEAVLSRNAEVDAAIGQLLEEAQGPQNFDSYIQISTERGLNANYLLDGYIERLQVQAQRNNNVTTYRADIDVRVRVFDVETQRLILSQRLDVTNNSIGGGDRDCGGIGGALKCAAQEAISVGDQTPDAAVQRALDNAGDAVRGFIQREMSLVLVDWEVDDDGLVSELVLKAAPDLEQGMMLDIARRTANRRGNETRDRSMGMAEVTEIDDGWAYARVTEGHEKVDEALNDGSVVVVKPSDDDN